MRSFIYKISVFSLLVLIPLISAEIYVESLPNPSKTKHQWMKQHSCSVNTLILGSSHTFYGVRPDKLSVPAFNLAQVAQTYRYDYYLLKHYPTDSLKNVILPYSYFSIYEDFENVPRERWNAIRYRLYMDCDIHPRISYYGFEFSSINSLTEKLKSLWQISVVSWDSLGWGTDFCLTNRNEPWDNGYEAALYNTYSDTSLVDLNVSILDSMMTYLDRRNIQLLMITTPLSPNFRAAQSPSQVNRNETVLKRLLRLHPNVKYVDYSSDSVFCDSDFFDSHHLNDYGAAKLTRILDQYLVR